MVGRLGPLWLRLRLKKAGRDWNHHGHSRNNKKLELKSPAFLWENTAVRKWSPGIHGQKRVLGVMPAAGWGAGFMIHNIDSLWLSILVVWAALLLASVLLGSLFFVISN